MPNRKNKGKKINCTTKKYKSQSTLNEKWNTVCHTIYDKTVMESQLFCMDMHQDQYINKEFWTTLIWKIKENDLKNSLKRMISSVNK